MTAGGISSVSFNATGEHCLTAGLDGAVLLHTIQESGQAHLSQLPVQAPALGDAQDVDILDDDAEATEVCADICITKFADVHIRPCSHPDRHQRHDGQIGNHGLYQWQRHPPDVTLMVFKSCDLHKSRIVNVFIGFCSWFMGMFIHLLLDSFFRFFVCLFVCILVHPFWHSVSHSLTHSVIHPPIHASLTTSCIHVFALVSNR